MNEDDIKKIMKEYEHLIKDLTNNIICPSCNKIVKPPFVNLGKDYHQSEGCIDCFDKLK